MLSFTSYKGPANQSHNEVPLTPVGVAVTNQTEITGAEEEGREGALAHRRWGRKWGQPLWKPACTFLKQLRTSCHTTPPPLFRVSISQQNLRTLRHMKIYGPCVHRHVTYSLWPRHGHDLWPLKGRDNVAHSHEKRRNTATCDHMGGP